MSDPISNSATLPSPVGTSPLQSVSNWGSGLGDIGSSILGGVTALGQSWLGYQTYKIDSKREQSLQEQELKLRATQQGLDFSGLSNTIVLILVAVVGLFVVLKLVK